MSSRLVIVHYNGQITTTDKGITFKCDVPKIFRGNEGITFVALKKTVHAKVRAGDTKMVADIHYRCPISMGHGYVEYRALKLEDDSDVEKMFFVFAEEASFGLIKLYADLVRSNEEITACLMKPKSVDEIIANFTEAQPSTSYDDHAIISLTQP